MSAEVFVAVKLFYINDFGGNGPHLQQVQLAVVYCPFDIFLLTESGADLLSYVV